MEQRTEFNKAFQKTVHTRLTQYLNIGKTTDFLEKGKVVH